MIKSCGSDPESDGNFKPDIKDKNQRQEFASALFEILVHVEQLQAPISNSLSDGNSQGQKQCIGKKIHSISFAKCSTNKGLLTTTFLIGKC